MRKHTTRRHHNPAAHPVRLALTRREPANGGWLLGLRIAERTALQALAAGTANRDNALTLCRMTATALRLAHEGIGPELLPLAQRCAGLALTEQRGLFRLADPTAADDLAELVDLADAQRNLTDRATFERARGRPV